MTKARSVWSAATLAVVAATAACGSTPFEVIEDVSFHPSLAIDLSQMTKLPSGLYIQDLTEGTGEPTVAGDVAEVSYVGWLSDGSQFDAGQFSFGLGRGQVVPGFDEGVLGMKVGGVRRILIPPALGYGEKGSGPVPPGAIMIFRIELLSVS